MDINEIAFMLILNAGNARNNAKEAENLASEYRFEQAEEFVQKAKEDLRQAHQMQTDLIQAEARGDQQQFGLIMVHAQDHLTMATLAIDHVNSMIRVFKELYHLKES